MLIHDLRACIQGEALDVVKGRLVHSGEKEPYPVAGIKVQLAVKGFFNFSEVLAETETDEEGNFAFHAKLIKGDNDCVLRVIESLQEILPTQAEGILGNPKERTVAELSVDLSGNNPEIDLGNLTIDFYQYQKGLPVLLQPTNSSFVPQQWTADYLLHLAEAGFDATLKEGLAAALTALKIGSVKEVIDLYGGPTDPSLSLNGDDTIELLLNGLYPVEFEKTEDPAVFTATINWDRYEQKPSHSPLLVNTTLTVKKVEDKLQVQTVTIQDSPSASKTYQFGEPGFAWALYLFNSMALVKGEAHSHLGLCHFVTEQNAMAAFKFLHRNNVRHLVFPHLRGIMEIDALGSKVIFGDNASVLVRSTGLTSAGLSTMLRDSLAGTCYTSYRPKQPLAESDRFAKAGNLCWNIISQSVDKFFEENQQNITQYWNEVYYMSKSLVEHSLAYRPFDNKPYDTWVDGSEIDDPSLPGRVVVDGELKAMRPITLSKDAPAEGDIERLKQFARFSIYVASFWHWVVHASQSKWGTNFNFGSLAPNEGGTPENYGATQPENANQIMHLAQVLSKFRDGSIISNPNGDIYQDLIERFKGSREAFKALGYNIDECLYGTII